ncbi:MAG: hypothetical protein ACK4TE_04030 [Hyphomonas sp.]
MRKLGDQRQAKRRPANDNAGSRRVVSLLGPDLPITEAELQLVEVWLSGIIASLAGAEGTLRDKSNSG